MSGEGGMLAVNDETVFKTRGNLMGKGHQPERLFQGGSGQIQLG